MKGLFVQQPFLNEMALIGDNILHFPGSPLLGKNKLNTTNLLGTSKKLNGSVNIQNSYGPELKLPRLYGTSSLAKRIILKPFS